MQVIEDKMKAGVSQEPDPFGDNTQLCYLCRSTQDRAEREMINTGIH